MFDFNALDHQAFIRQALKEAACALQEGERPVGAVIVYDGKIIGRGQAVLEFQWVCPTQPQKPFRDWIVLLI